MSLYIGRAAIPFSPAYLVFHDAYDNGAMEVWPMDSYVVALQTAERKQEALDESGYDETGVWAAYQQLPKNKIWKYHGGN